MSFSPQKHTTVDLVFVVPLALFFLLFELGHGSLASWDEAIYASVAAHCVRTGDWLNLVFNGRPWLQESPLSVWMTALAFQIFGINEFTARLFSALCGVGAVVVTYFLGRSLVNRWTGLLSALVLLSSAHFIRYSRFGMPDIPLMFFISLAMYLFWLGRLRNRYLIFSGLAVGAAVMTKGYVALLVFPAMWLFALCAGRTDLLSRSSYWVGVMIAVALALPWHLFMMFCQRQQAPGAPWAGFSDLFGGQPYYYLRSLVNKYHPWILIGIWAGPYFVYRAWREREEEAVLLAVWIFSMLGILSLFKYKEAPLILTIYPALSVAVAYFLSKMFKEKHGWPIRGLFVLILACHVPYSNIFDHDYSPEIKEIAAPLLRQVPAKSQIALYNYHETPALAFYSGKNSYYIDNPEQLSQALSRGGLHLVIRDIDLERLGGPSFLKRAGLVPSAKAHGLNLISQKS